MTDISSQGKTIDETWNALSDGENIVVKAQADQENEAAADREDEAFVEFTRRHSHFIQSNASKRTNQYVTDRLRSIQTIAYHMIPHDGV